MSYDNMHNSNCHMRICTAQNVIWEYVQPKMSFENMHNPKCLIRISTNQNVIWEYVQPKIQSLTHVTMCVYWTIFSNDILGCTYSYILRWHIGLCILSDDTLGCIYSHILILHFGFSIFSYSKMTFWVVPILRNQVIYCLTISWYQWCYFIVTLLFCLVWYRSKWLI
jgi:hypothetical protein